jgi:hypothetical protein
MSAAAVEGIQNLVTSIPTGFYEPPESFGMGCDFTISAYDDILPSRRPYPNGRGCALIAVRFKLHLLPEADHPFAFGSTP